MAARALYAADVPPEQPRPQVTIADPRRPELPPEVIVHESTPRTSPRQRKGVVATILVVALLGGSVAVLQNHRATRVANQAILAAVQVAFANSTDLPELDHRPEVTVLVLRNDGPDPLQIKQVAVDDGTFAVVGAPSRLAAAELGRLVVRPTGPCPTDDNLPVPATMSASVVVRGLTTLVHLPVSSFAADTLRSDQRLRCGLIPLPTALAVQGTATERVAGGVHLHASLFTAGVRPLEVRRIQLARGLRLVSGPALPLLIPQQTAPQSIDQMVTIDLVVAVSSCRQALTYGGEDRPSGEDVWLTFARPGGQETYVAHLAEGGYSDQPQVSLTDGCFQPTSADPYEGTVLPAAVPTH